jgi:hypothetical protein
MTPGIKRLYHWAWPSLPALSVPIHDGTDYSVVSRFYLCNFSAPCAHLLEIFGPLE